MDMTLMAQHADTVIVLTGILAAVLWMNHKFNEVEKDIVIIKTVLMLKGDLPRELVSKSNQQKE